MLTPGGRGAVASIGLHGGLCLIDPYFRPVNGGLAASQELNRICFGYWGDDATENNGDTEDVVFIRTAEQCAEVHCHGGVAAVERILNDIISAGGAIVSESDWLTGTCDEIQAECLLTLTSASTQRTACCLLQQVSLLPQAIQTLALLDREERRSRIQKMLNWSRFGLHLVIPWQVVLCGRPNVGKSSLINALVGFTRSVVYDQPGTTRDVVTAQTALDGWPVEFSDTAGLRQTGEKLEAEGIARARERMKQADLLIIVLDATSGFQEEDRDLLRENPDAIVVWNKSDLPQPAGGLLEKALPDAIPPIQVSALTGLGLNELTTAIVSRLVPAVPDANLAYPVTASLHQRLVAMLSD